MAIKDFDAMVASRTKPEFVVGGQKFTARAKIPWKQFAAIIKFMQSDEEAVSDEEKAEKFFRLVLSRGDRERFMELLNAGGEDDEEFGESSIVSIEQVGKLTEWLMEHYTGKPPENDNSSSDGAPNTGAPSNVISLNPQTTKS